MITIIKKLSIVAVAALVFAGCTKQSKDSGPFPLSDVKPKVPVTVSNAMDYRPEPTVSTSKAGGGTIQIVLSIPSGTGRSIKEITKVAASTTYTQIQSTGTTGFYTAAPIAGSGTTATFNTSITEYISKFGGSAPASNTELARRFYFLVTLDDNSVIVTEAVRVLVLD